MLQKNIANELNADVRNIYRLEKKAEGLPKGLIPERKKGSERLMKTSLRVDKVLRREMMQNPRIRDSELKKKHPKLLQDASIRTFQNRLSGCLDAKLRQSCF